VDKPIVIVTWQCSEPESIQGPFGHQSGSLPLHYEVTLLHG